MIELKKNTSASDSDSKNLKFTYSAEPVVSYTPVTKSESQTSQIEREFSSRDIRKSILLSFFLVILNTAIYFLLKNNIIPMSILGLE